MPTSIEVVEFLDRVERTLDRARFPHFEADQPSDEQIELELATLAKDAQRLASEIRMSQTFSLEKLSGRIPVTTYEPEQKKSNGVEPTMGRALDSAIHVITGLPKGWTGLV